MSGLILARRTMLRPKAVAAAAPLLRGVGSNTSGFTSSLTLTLSTATASGDVIVVFGTNYAGNAAPISGVTGCGATWTRLEGGALGKLDLWIGKNLTVGQTNVTVTYGGGGGQAVIFAELWGGANSTPAAHISANGTGPAYPTTGTMTSTAANQVAVGAWYDESVSGGTAADVPSAWTVDNATVSGGNSSINLPAHFDTTAASQTLTHKRSAQIASGWGWAGSAVLLNPA